MKKNITFIGAGVMGLPIIHHLLKAQHSVKVFTRTPAKAETAVKAGALLCESIPAACRESEIIFTMVGHPHDVAQIYFGNTSAQQIHPESILHQLKPGTLLVDMTTSRPALAEQIDTVAREKNCFAFDAPVSGGDIGARNGTLTIMAGGDPVQFNELEPVLQLFGKNIIHTGPSGTGQHMKMANQILNTGNMIGMVESLLYAGKAGLDLEKVINTIGSGAAGSWAINHLGPRIIQNDFAPGFKIEHFLKDINIALSETEKMGLQLPGLQMLQKFYKTAVDAGMAENGTQALYKVIAKLSAVQ